MKAEVFINRHIVGQNKKQTKETGELHDQPAISINTSKGVEYCKTVQFPADAKLIQDPTNARCSGATIWIECEYESLIIDGVPVDPSYQCDRTTLSEGDDIQNAIGSPPIKLRNNHQVTHAYNIYDQTGIQLGDVAYWNPEQLPNQHIVTIGASGSGKTQTLKAIALNLHKHYPVNVYIVDFHGDQQIEGELCYELDRLGEYGINPLKINPDPRGGGPEIQSLIITDTLKKSIGLGPIQEGFLISAINNIYEAKGIDSRNPETWKNEPNFLDLEEYLYQQTLSEWRNEDIENISYAIDLNELSDEIKQSKGIYFCFVGSELVYIGSSVNIYRRIMGNHHILSKMNEYQLKFYYFNQNYHSILVLKYYLIKRFKPKLNEAFLPAIDKEAKRVHNKLEATFKYDIYSKPDFPRNHNLIRLDLSKVPMNIASLAAESLGQQLMSEHRLLGESNNLRTFLFIDEAKEMSQKPTSALSRIMADGRKFGLGLVVASQSERHLSADVIGNSATKIVLPVDQTEVKKVASKFRFAESKVADLQPLQALIRMGKSAIASPIIPYYQLIEDVNVYS
jgi:hypothetical protein